MKKLILSFRTPFLARGVPAPKLLRYGRGHNFLNFVKRANTVDSKNLTYATRLTADKIATICQPKPVLGVRRDFHNNRATDLIISNRLFF